LPNPRPSRRIWQFERSLSEAKSRPDWDRLEQFAESY
jgi:hypothetical protein